MPNTLGENVDCDVDLHVSGPNSVSDEESPSRRPSVRIPNAVNDSYLDLIYANSHHKNASIPYFNRHRVQPPT